MQDRPTPALNVPLTAPGCAEPLHEHEFPRHADTFGVRSIVKVTHPFTVMIFPIAWSDHGLRLVLGLLHLTLAFIESKPEGEEHARREALVGRTSLLYRTIGPAAANGAKALHRGVEVLRTTALFDELELPSGASFVRWRFSSAAMDALRNRSAFYGLVDIRAVGRLERALPVWLHLEVRQIWRMPCPSVVRTVEQLGCVMGIKAPSWSKISRPLLRDLQAVCRHNRAAIVVRPEQAADADGIGTVTLNVLHPKMTWFTSTLIQANPGVREIVLVTPDEIRRVRRSDVMARTLRPVLEWQRSPRPSPSVPDYFTAEASP